MKTTKDARLKIRRASDQAEAWFSIPSEGKLAEEWSGGSDCYIAAGAWVNQVAAEQPKLTFISSENKHITPTAHE